MSKILKTHPKSVQAHKDLIMMCLDDKDESIRLRALDLLYGMVSSTCNNYTTILYIVSRVKRIKMKFYLNKLLIDVFFSRYRRRT